jgi:glucose-1-phosphate adenylyltransferase
MQNILAILLAGGTGERLSPLTLNTAKPAVPFGGNYRIIDFTLSNCINSGIRRILVLTQYKALELIRHIRDGWTFLSPELGEYVEVIPPMKRVHADWYLGTADAVFQNIQTLMAEGPEHCLILAGDQIYKMNYDEMIAWHHLHQADVTLATIQVSPDEASRFGVVEIGQDYLVKGFEEKPKHGNPVRSAFNPGMVSASMGVYLFNTEVMMHALMGDAEDPNSSHDFGRDVIPRCIRKARVVAYDFIDLNDKTVKYWRDVGTIEAYYEANMDLVSVVPDFNLYDKRWPIRTNMPQMPPAKFVFAQEGRRMGVAIDSIVSGGCIVSGGRVVRSILSPGVRINSYCEVESSILMHNAEVGRYSRIRRAIIGPNMRIPESSVIGYDIQADRAKGYTVTESGIVVICENQQIYTGQEPYTIKQAG